MFSLFFRH